MLVDKPSRRVFGGLMLTCRNRRGLTQKKLAELCSVSQSYISLIESGQRGIHNLALAERLIQTISSNESESTALSIAAGLMSGTAIVDLEEMIAGDDNIWNLSDLVNRLLAVNDPNLQAYRDELLSGLLHEIGSVVTEWNYLAHALDHYLNRNYSDALDCLFLIKTDKRLGDALRKSLRVLEQAIYQKIK